MDGLTFLVVGHDDLVLPEDGVESVEHVARPEHLDLLVALVLISEVVPAVHTRQRLHKPPLFGFERGHSGVQGASEIDAF